MYIQPFTTIVDWPEMGCLMEVSTYYKSADTVFLLGLADFQVHIFMFNSPILNPFHKPPWTVELPTQNTMTTEIDLKIPDIACVYVTLSDNTTMLITQSDFEIPDIVGVYLKHQTSDNTYYIHLLYPRLCIAEVLLHISLHMHQPRHNIVYSHNKM